MPAVDMIPGMDFGVGVNIGGAVAGEAVIRTPPEVVPGTGAQAASITLTLVESQDEQERALNLSTEVSAGWGLFGGSAKFQFSQQSKFHQYSVWLVIQVSVRNSETHMHDVQLRPAAADLLMNGNTARFREEFGDLFVKGIVTGGEYAGILEIQTTSTQDQSDVKAALQAHGIIGAVAVGTDDSFSSSVRKATENRKVTFTSFQIGGDQTASIVPETMIAHALGFAKTVVPGQSFAFSAILADYKTLDLPPNPNAIDLENAKEVLEVVMQKRRDALTTLNAVNFIIAHPEQFLNAPDMNPVANQLATAIAALTRAASVAVNRPLQAVIPAVDVPQIILPSRVPGTVVSPPPPEVRVPSLIGMDALEALRLIRSLGLSPAVGNVEDGPHLNHVVAQDPLPGAAISKGNFVTVRRGAIMSQMPDAQTMQILSEFGI